MHYNFGAHTGQTLMPKVRKTGFPLTISIINTEIVSLPNALSKVTIFGLSCGIPDSRPSFFYFYIRVI